MKKVHVDPVKGVKWNDKITLPYEPFIGTIGTSPEIEAITSLQPDYYGGNMDLPDVAPGRGHLSARQCAGRTCFIWATATRPRATANSAASPSSIRRSPRFRSISSRAGPSSGRASRTRSVIMTIGSGRPMEDAARIAYRELVRWMAQDYGFDELDAYMLLTQAGTRAARQHGGPQIHARRLDFEDAPGVRQGHIVP